MSGIDDLYRKKQKEKREEEARKRREEEERQARLAEQKAKEEEEEQQRIEEKDRTIKEIIRETGLLNKLEELKRKCKIKYWLFGVGLIYAGEETRMDVEIAIGDDSLCTGQIPYKTERRRVIIGAEITVELVEDELEILRKLYPDGYKNILRLRKSDCICIEGGGSRWRIYRHAEWRGLDEALVDAILSGIESQYKAYIF